MTSSDSISDRLVAHVTAKVVQLQKGYLKDESSSVAALAILRRGIHQEPGADLRVAALTVGDFYTDDDRRSFAPTTAEWSSHAALTLFAVHQQSHRDKAMHVQGDSIGAALYRLSRQLKEATALGRRFSALMTADTFEETLHHGRGLIQQLRAASIPLDYGRFARDLYWLQYPATATRVRRAWGRDFYKVTPVDAEPDERSDSPDPTDSAA